MWTSLFLVCRTAARHQNRTVSLLGVCSCGATASLSALARRRGALTTVVHRSWPTLTAAARLGPAGLSAFKMTGCGLTFLPSPWRIVFGLGTCLSQLHAAHHSVWTKAVGCSMPSCMPSLVRYRLRLCLALYTSTLTLKLPSKRFLAFAASRGRAPASAWPAFRCYFSSTLSLHARASVARLSVFLGWRPTATSARFTMQATASPTSSRSNTLLHRHPPTTIRPLNLTFSHPFLVLRSAASTAAPPLLIGDPRRLCRRVMQSRALADWQLSKTQSRFSRFPVDARAFWLSIVSSSPSLAWLALRVVTDTLQWVWKDHKVCVRSCHECACELTVEHLVRCHDARRERGGACVAVSRLMHSLGVAFQPLAAVWSSRADLPGVLKAFGILSAVSLDAETAALAGIFDAAVARRALRGRGASSNLCDAAVPALRLIIFSLLISRRFANT